MYHQFKELGDVDITKEPMEVGPTAHYTMGGIKRRSRDAAVAHQGALRRRRVRRGHARHRTDSAATRCATCSSSGASPGSTPPSSRRPTGAKELDAAQIDDAAQEALAPFNRDEGPNPFALHEDLMNQMQRYVGIMRVEEDLAEGLKQIDRLKEAASRCKIDGPRHYNNGWHETIDMRNLLVVSEAMARAARARKESRGGHAREDFRRWTRITGRR